MRRNLQWIMIACATALIGVSSVAPSHAGGTLKNLANALTDAAKAAGKGVDEVIDGAASGARQLDTVAKGADDVAPAAQPGAKALDRIDDRTIYSPAEKLGDDALGGATQQLDTKANLASRVPQIIANPGYVLKKFADPPPAFDELAIIKQFPDAPTGPINNVAKNLPANPAKNLPASPAKNLPDAPGNVGKVAQKPTDPTKFRSNWGGDTVSLMKPLKMLDPKAAVGPAKRATGWSTRKKVFVTGGAALGLLVTGGGATIGTLYLTYEPARDYAADAADQLEDLGKEKVILQVKNDADTMVEIFEVFPTSRKSLETLQTGEFTAVNLRIGDTVEIFRGGESFTKFVLDQDQSILVQ